MALLERQAELGLECLTLDVALKLGLRTHGLCCNHTAPVLNWSIGGAQPKLGCQVASEVLELLDLLPEQAPQHYLTYELRGQVYRIFGRPEEALDEFAVAIALAGERWLAARSYLLQGVALHDLGRNEEALESMQTAMDLRLGPADTQAALDLLAAWESEQAE